MGSLPDEPGLKGTPTGGISPKRRGFLLALHRASSNCARGYEGVSGSQDTSERGHSGHRLREPAQNPSGLAKTKAGDYVKVITAYLTGLKMIIAAHSNHSSIISA